MVGMAVVGVDGGVGEGRPLPPSIDGADRSG
jgi:hypothetical protein